MLFEKIENQDKIFFFELLETSYKILKENNKIDLIGFDLNFSNYYRKDYTNATIVGCNNNKKSYVIEPIVSNLDSILNKNSFNKLIDGMNQFNYSYIITFVSVAETIINEKYNLKNTYLIIKNNKNEKFKIITEGKESIEKININEIILKIAKQNSYMSKYYFINGKDDKLLLKENKQLKLKIIDIKKEITELSSIKEISNLMEAFTIFHRKLGLDDKMINYLLRNGSIGFDYKLDFIPDRVMVKYKHFIQNLKFILKKS